MAGELSLELKGVGALGTGAELLEGVMLGLVAFDVVPREVPGLTFVDVC